MIFYLIKMEKKKKVCLNCMREYEDDGYSEQLCPECRKKLGSIRKEERKREIMDEEQRKALRRASLDCDFMIMFVILSMIVYIIAVFV